MIVLTFALVILNFGLFNRNYMQTGRNQGMMGLLLVDVQKIPQWGPYWGAEETLTVLGTREHLEYVERLFRHIDPSLQGVSSFRQHLEAGGVIEQGVIEAMAPKVDEFVQAVERRGRLNQVTELAQDLDAKFLQAIGEATQ